LALFQQPPPQPFIGGAQPLAPRELTPPPYIPSNPPFGLDSWLNSTLAQWQVTPWPQQRTAKLIQAAAAAAANPPFDQTWLFSILNQWQITAPITQARQLSPGIPGQSADKPPNRAIDLRAALISWQPPPPTQTFYARFTQGIDNPPFGLPPRWRFDAPPTPAQVQYARYVQQVAVIGADNPPFGLRGYLNTLSQWQARPLTPFISGWQIQEYVPDNPPFGLESWLASVLAQWQIVSLPQQRNLRLVQAAIAAAADNPPFGMPPDWIWGTLGQWQITTPALIRYPKLAQAFIAAVDQPPPRTTLNFITTLKAWEPAVIQPQHNIYLPQPFVVVPTDNPPFGMPPDWLYTVLTATWKPGEPLPKLLAKILQAGAAPVIATGQKEKRKWRRSSS